MTERARRSLRRVGDSSHEVLCLSAPSALRVRSSRRAPLRRRLPSSGFLNPSTVFSPRRLAGLFHPAGTPRLPPSGRSSFQGAVPPLGGRCPLAVTFVSPLPCGSEKAAAQLQGLAPPGSPLHFGQRLTSRRPGALLGFTLSRVLPPSAVVRASASLPSRASAEFVRDGLSPAPQGISAPKARLVSRKTADPLEVCDLVKSLVRSGTQPDRAYRFTSGPTPRRRSTWRPSLVRAGSLPEPDENLCRSTSSGGLLRAASHVAVFSTSRATPKM
jgi:hypothetical protein